MAATPDRKFQIPEDLHRVPDEQNPLYNLTRKYEAFWYDVYKIYCHGSQIKVPNDDLTDEDLRALGETIKLCYENERFLPTKLASPILEACFFNREKENLVYVSPDMFLNYVDSNDKQSLLDNSIDEIVKFEIVEKYCPEIRDDEETENGNNDNEVSNEEVALPVSSELYEKAARIIMYREADRLIEIWTPILVNVINLEQFRFLMKNTNYDMPEDKNLDKDLLKKHFENFLPHKQWKMCFYRWPDPQIEFYRDIISKDYEWPKNPFFCFRCKKQATTKHILGTTTDVSCTTTFETMCKERHDCILRIIEQQLDEAIAKAQGFFSGTNPDDWGKMIMKGNRKYKWPRCLESFRTPTSPHIIVFNTNLKKVLIAEMKTSWERWFGESGREMKYLPLVEDFKAKGFEVRYDFVETGSRGVVCKDMYNLFTHGFGMSHGKASRAMQKISKTIIRCAFNEYNINFKKREEPLLEKLNMKVEEVERAS